MIVDPAVRDLLVDAYLALGRPWYGEEDQLVERIAAVQTELELAVVYGTQGHLGRSIEQADAARVRRRDVLDALEGADREEVMPLAGP
jgi:hypothetical protein